ncbi:hypothetical protein [Nonomuraea sp. NPDC002799]
MYEDDVAPYDWFADDALHAHDDPHAARSSTDDGPHSSDPHTEWSSSGGPHTEWSSSDRPHSGGPHTEWARGDHSMTERPRGDHPPAGWPQADQGLTGSQDDDLTRPGHLRADRGWADHPQTAGQSRSEEQQPAPWPGTPVVPGAPPWEPPPAFTAAAAGMQVWPQPVTDPHAMPTWPAATGELVAEPDDPDTAPRFDPNATNPEGFPRPAHYFDPEAAKRDTARSDTPYPAAPTAPHYGATAPTTPLPTTTAPATPHPTATAPTTPHYGATAPTTPLPTTTAPATPHPSATAPTTPHHGATTPTTPHYGPTAPTTPLPTTTAPATERPDTQEHGTTHPGETQPNPAPTAQQGPSPRPRTTPLSAPVAPPQEGTQPPHHFDPHPTSHPPEPGDIPVWPPTPATGDKLPELPFPRDTWGHKPTTPLELPPGGSPAFPPGAFKQPPFQTPPPPPTPPGRSRRALFVTLGALALAGVATGGFFAYQAVSPPAPTTAATRATTSPPPSAEPAATPPPDASGTSVLNSEQTDPQKLSLSEAFPKKKVSAAGTTFTRVKAHMETSCDKAATGAFADALKAQKCTRVLRATYVDSKRHYAVTTGIAVLPTKEAAAGADQAKNLGRNIWFRPLPGAAGSGGERVHIAGGYAAGMVWGRYIVFSYATHADGHTPDSKEKTLPKVSGAFRDQTSLVLERRVTKG